MEETIDFSNLNVDDINVIGSESVIQEVQNPDPAPEVAQQVDQAPTPDPVVETKVQPEPAQYKFKDDFIKNAVEYYEKTGNLLPYLEVKTVDFNSMSDEDIVKRNLRDQYSDLSEKAFERLYKQQVTDKYKLDVEEYDEDDSALGRELLKAEANRLRSDYIKWQSQFSPPDTSGVADENAELSQRFMQQVQESQITRSLLETKRISIKTGDDEFNYELQAPEQIYNMTIDNDKFFEQFSDGNGGLDYTRWYKTAAYSQNPEQFERSLINYGKALGRQEVTKDIKNPSFTRQGDVPTEGSGDFVSGLLKAFETKGIHK